MAGFRYKERDGQSADERVIKKTKKTQGRHREVQKALGGIDKKKSEPLPNILLHEKRKKTNKEGEKNHGNKYKCQNCARKHLRIYIGKIPVWTEKKRRGHINSKNMVRKSLPKNPDKASEA